MRRLFLLLPLLALAASPTRAEGPATNAPALPAWFGGIRIGMSTDEFFAMGLDAEEVSPFEEEPRPGEKWFSFQPDGKAFGVDWLFVFKDGLLVLANAEDDADKVLRASILSELKARFGEPDVSAPFVLSAFLGDEAATVRTAWTNGASLVAVVVPENPEPGSLNLSLSDRSYAASGPEWVSLLFYGLVPADLPGESIRVEQAPAASESHAENAEPEPHAEAAE